MIIHLLSGPVRSGKTTRLTAWASGQASVAGLLMPAENRATRRFHDLRTGLQWSVNARPGDWQAQCIGPHRFSSAAFGWANHALLGAATTPETRCLVVDEVGPLELRGQGLAPALHTILHTKSYQPANLVLVVRTPLVVAAVHTFNLQRWQLQDFSATNSY
ncbi:hypothetical protein F0P96_13165 [Hymenobacter busanensis]|uniref:Uncharacterized protein n=1 Tax=Hymenobacter busanensis TaxID=2607656 RepID=A0A7L4ZWK2_9BACT|nr:hypothetical protein [Hymenobacter busanensis]KAA9332417.1 hypothetical protein F0P96_13165 [Hymenobacter busanensis]QHJ07246.1 hypothetical protein GUY19_08110 [Hymenobacter busanensis]